MKNYQIFNSINREDLEVTGISFDSRTIKPNEIFVAIKGENFDGHKFINSAIKNGASTIILENYKGFENFPYYHYKCR